MENYQGFIDRKKKEFEKNSHIEFKDIGRKGKFIFEREACTFMKQHNLEEKVFIIERLRLIEIKEPVLHRDIKIGDKEYRFCYYIIGKNGKAKNRWTWGQFCPTIPIADFNKLLKQAKVEGTLLA